MINQFQNFQPVVSEYLVYVRPVPGEVEGPGHLGGYMCLARLPSRTKLYIGNNQIELMTLRIPLGFHGQDVREELVTEGEEIMQAKAKECYAEFSFDFILQQKVASITHDQDSESFFAELILLLFWLEEEEFVDSLFSSGLPHPNLTWPATKQWTQLREVAHSKLQEFVG